MPPLDATPPPVGPPAGPFLTTRWTVVLRAGDSLSPERENAMAQLCLSYWYPLYAFVRRKGHGHEDASDLTQEFFARLIRKHHLRSVHHDLGRFRTFLLTAMTHFLANEWDKSQAARRGGGRPIVSLDGMAAEERYRTEPKDPDTPESLYERRWAQTLVDTVIERLAKEMAEDRFEVLKGYLLDDKGAVRYEEAARLLGMTVSGVTSAIFRMRARFRVLLFEEVANTVASPEEIEPELRHLAATLGR